MEAAGRTAVTIADVMPGVRELIDEVRLEVLMGDGTRLIVLLDPLGATVGHDEVPRQRARARSGRGDQTTTRRQRPREIRST